MVPTTPAVLRAQSDRLKRPLGIYQCLVFRVRSFLLHLVLLQLYVQIVCAILDIQEMFWQFTQLTQNALHVPWQRIKMYLEAAHALTALNSQRLRCTARLSLNVSALLAISPTQIRVKNVKRTIIAQEIV